MTRPIDYARPVPWHRRRRWRIAVVVAVALLATLAAGYRSGPAAGRRLRLLYWQHRCLTYDAPADQVVYDETPAGLAALTGRPRYALINTEPTYDYSTMAVVSSPCPAAACHEPACYAAWTRSGGGGVTHPGALIFMHERVSHAGVRRLVVVRDTPSSSPVNRFDTVGGREVHLSGLATWRTDPPAIFALPLDFDEFRTGSRLPLRVYAGQADPADAARFSVRYEVGGRTHVALGRLTDAGDDVDWTEPPGPTVRPADPPPPAQTHGSIFVGRPISPATRP